MSKGSGYYGSESRHVCRTLQQGDVILINFGDNREGSRSLYGKRPGYVISRHADDKAVGVIMVVPLFREKSRDNAGSDVEIRPLDCRGLRYTEYAQVMNIQKIRKHQVIRRIGRVKNDTIHAEILSSMWKQVEREDG